MFTHSSVAQTHVEAFITKTAPFAAHKQPWIIEEGEAGGGEGGGDGGEPQP